MKKEKEVKLTYICEKCSTSYQNKYCALECESLPISNTKFKVGDVVTVFRWVNVHHGTIVCVFGPYPPSSLAFQAIKLPRTENELVGTIGEYIGPGCTYKQGIINEVEEFLWALRECDMVGRKMMLEKREKAVKTNEHLFIYAIDIPSFEELQWFFEEELEKR